MFPGRLYETHLLVRNLEDSIEFYKKLGLKFAHKIEKRRVAFFWFQEEKEQMLGLWEVSEKQWERRHFAFGVTYDEILTAIEWLLDREISPRESFGRQPLEPLVHTWMPAAFINFNDPDGNSLEFISVLEDEPENMDYVPYLSEWKTLKANGTTEVLKG
ncbi:VOC family protein [Pseudalkalibacillus caeni]|uniref:VOC family protein n=1 Tax=Exobacillus caeni TaxID=2574798 RepID=A0A5R9F7P8_9BACL|nr:VOC family protein [Pseudalkalibacillus caeni]TLS38280.1 VOC family protein [Pseudalkalibacillus caeni]